MEKENKELTTVEAPKHELITKDFVINYMNTFGIANGLIPSEKEMFIQTATLFQLNPFKREIYAIPYDTKDGRKLSIITGYEVYLKRAERTATLDGWKVWTEGTLEEIEIVKTIKKKDGGSWDKKIKTWTGNLVAKIEIWRKDRSKPFIHEVAYDEYNQQNEIWFEKPKTMLKKVCIAQAFRMAFPDEFSGMPYISDELPDRMTNIVDVTPEKQPEQPETKTETKQPEKPKQESKKQDDTKLFERAKEALLSAKDKAALDKSMGNIEKSKKFNSEQLEELSKIFFNKEMEFEPAFEDAPDNIGDFENEEINKRNETSKQNSNNNK